MLKINCFKTAVLLLLFIAGFGQIAASDQQDLIQGSITLPYPENAAVTLGMGWNLQTNEAVPNICIKNFTTYEVTKNQTFEELTQGNNRFSLSKSLDISSSQSVSIAADYAGVGGQASLSNQMNMAKQFDEETDDRYVLAKQHIITKWSALKSSGGKLIDLTDSAKKIASEASSAQFSEQCGNGYVARIEYGGSFYGLFNMHTTSYSNSQNFKSSLQLAAGISYSGLGGSAKADASSDSKTATSLNSTIGAENISITVLESGGSASAAGTDISTVLNQYRNFPLGFLNAGKTVGDSPATEFRMVIIPYPSRAQLTQFDSQLSTIAREYAKWKYLTATLGKIISSAHNGNSEYTFIRGVTLTPEGLANMQNMAQAKVDRISIVARTCMDRLKGKIQNPQNSSVDLDPCSLNSKNPNAYNSAGTNKVAWTTNSGTKYVPIAESDVSYLVRLPFQSSIYDAMTKTKVDETGASKYSDVIFNQVMGIYKERCGNQIIPRFCENEAKTEQAIKTYISPANGAVYSKIQSLSNDGNLCISAEAGNRVSAQYCSNDKEKSMYFYIDKEKKLVRSLTGKCLKSKSMNAPTNNRYVNRGNEHNSSHWTNHYSVLYQLELCPDKYDGATPPTGDYSATTYLTPQAVADYPHKFILQDLAITSAYHVGSDTCLALQSDTSGSEITAHSCKGNGIEFSMLEPLFITDEVVSRGIIDAYGISPSVMLTPTIANYNDIGLKGVTAANLNSINKKLPALYRSRNNPTTEQLSRLVE
jgi:hypothetical protein